MLNYTDTHTSFTIHINIYILLNTGNWDVIIKTVISYSNQKTNSFIMQCTRFIKMICNTILYVELLFSKGREFIYIPNSVGPLRMNPVLSSRKINGLIWVIIR